MSDEESTTTTDTFQYSQRSAPTARLRWLRNVRDDSLTLQQAFEITHFHNEEPTATTLEWREIPIAHPYDD